MNAKIFLVRHGESLGNQDERNNKKFLDANLPLSHKGCEQGYKAGLNLKNILAKEETNVTKIMSSPFLRARQTTDEIMKSIHPYVNTPTIINDSLSEVNLGILYTASKLERETLYKQEWDAYNKSIENNRLYWGKFPNGESPMEADIKARQVCNTIKEEVKSNTVDNYILVAHALKLRIIVMNLTGLSYQEFAKLETQKNGSIQLLEVYNTNEDFVNKGFL